MKKSVLFFTLTLLSASMITGCRSNMAGTSNTNKVSTEKETETESETTSTASSENTGAESTAPEDSNSPASDNASGAEAHSASDTAQSSAPELSQQGWDSMILYDINLNATTVMRGTDGTGNWYDENGVSYGNLDTVDESAPITNGNGEVYYWNGALAEQAAKASDSAAVADVKDPYDLYSWDAETNSYIPYQQADSDASPIGRGNGWYYYDAATESYLPW